MVTGPIANSGLQAPVGLAGAGPLCAIGREASPHRDQERSLWLHQAVAGRLVADPEPVLERATANLRKLREVHSDGAVTRSWEEWEQVLARGPIRVLEALTSREPWARELRQNTPFAGVLTAEERTAVLDAFRRHWRRSRAALRRSTCS